MSIWVSWIIVDFINNLIISSYAFKSYLQRNNKKSKLVLLSYFIILIILTIINTIFISNEEKIIKSLVKIMLSGILCKFLFKEKLSKSMISIFLIYIIFAVHDSLFGLFYLSILNLSLEAFMQNAMLILFVNIIIAVLTILTIYSKIGQKYITGIINWYDAKHDMNIVVNIFLCIIVLWIFINRNTTGNPTIYEYIINLIVIIIIMTFVIGFFKENSDKNKIRSEYDNLLDYAKTYEQEVVEKSKWQHEYENQLIILKDKISVRNKEAREYIDKLLKNKPVDINSQWLRKLSKFPDVGIKGLLCYKIGQMQAKGINVFVDISENLKIKKIHKDLLEKNLQDISRIFGVYIDNAAEAAAEASNKYFVFEFYCTDDKIVFQISNTFSGSLDIQKVGNDKFTTKGKGHGYGLSLVKDILENNQQLSQEREINGMYYVQRLIVKLKK